MRRRGARTHPRLSHQARVEQFQSEQVSAAEY